MTSQEIKNLKTTNYIRQAQPSTNYWVDFSKQKLMSCYFDKFEENFNIIIYSQADIEADFYIIPFQVLKNHFTDINLAKDSDENRPDRWVLNINNHILKVTNCLETIDVKEYYSNRFLSKDFSKDEQNDYEIENKKQEINVRVKQSKFRKRVLENFDNRCCISGIQEEELLIASHIIPWKDKSTCRLDPANGLCLFITYDKLFDKGYFTLTDDCTVLIIEDLSNLSPILQTILKKLKGKQISTPYQKINLEYIEYHRNKIFIDRVKN